MEDIQFLKEFQQKLLTQENNGQAAPRFWAIMDYKWVVTEEGHHDRISLYSPDTCESVAVDEYINEILNGDRRDKFTEEQIEELKEIQEYFMSDLEDWIKEKYFMSDLEDWIKENDGDEYLIYEEEVSFIVPNTYFFTKAEAKKHLENNRHHYSDKAHTFAMTAWRSPKVERLMQIKEVIFMEDKHMTIDDFKELCVYIDKHHSFRKGQGKMVKYISPTLDMRIGKIFHINLRRAGKGKDFSLTNENKNTDLKQWILDWLKYGEWED